MDLQRINYLLGQFQAGRLLPDEREELRQLLLIDEYRLPLTEAISASMQAKEADQVFNADDAEELFERIISIDKLLVKQAESSSPVYRVHFLKTTWFRYAAAILLMLGASTYLYFNRDTKSIAAGKPVLEEENEITRIKNGAILTLADGTQVALDSLKQGVIATQNGTQAVLRNGLLAYDRSGASSGEAVFNIMSTSKGRQFQLVLPDGSKVWLNAASSITYPTVFTGKERLVKITGEAYMEVARNEKMPFRVNVNDKAEVEVLGTRFNINAYDNEAAINTTLLEGKVKVAAVATGEQSPPRRSVAASRMSQAGGKDRVTLKTLFVVLEPGQQARLAAGGQDKTVAGKYRTTGKIKLVNDIDIEKVMAWKNGLFNFENTTLEEVMRQLERWYDIEVIYQNSVPEMELSGKMTRGVTLDGLLKNLGEMGIRYRLEGRRLMIF